MLTDEQMFEKIFCGFNVQHFDIMLNEADETVALCISQDETEAPLTPDHPGYILVATFADNVGLPFFLVRYDDESRHVTPVNNNAYELLPETKSMNQDEWERFIENCTV